MSRARLIRLSLALRTAFQDELREALGLAFPGSRIAALDSGVDRAAARVTDGNPGALLAHLRQRDPAAMAALIEELTVGETYFFRDPIHFAFLQRLLLARTHPLRLWSAGCASGEEPYSMAMVALDTLGAGAAGMVEIIGTDVHPGALTRAGEGLYRPWSFRGVDPALRDRWFTAEGARWRVRDQVRALVRFAPLNLLDTASPSWPREVDVVFCRNVLVYLGGDAIARVCAGMRRTLAPDGWLITAPCDPLLGSLGLLTDVSPGFLAYRAGPVPRDDGTRPARPVLSARPALPAPPSMPALPPAPARSPGVQPGRAAPAEDAAGPDLLAGEPGPPDAGGPDLGEVLRLADQGQITAALRTADALLSSAPFLPAGYVLRATLRQSLGDHESAVQDIQRALLLDRSLAFAHVLAAASRTALGQIRAALHALYNARKVLFAQPADAPVAGTQGVTVSELLSLCEQLERVLMRAQPTKQS